MHRRSFVALLFAVVLAAVPVPGAAQLEGCLGGGVAPRADVFLPDLGDGFVVESEDIRDDAQLAATFPDPDDALSRLHAYCWTGNAERVYAGDGAAVDVSVHTFIGPEGAILAQRWFGYQRMRGLGLRWDAQPLAPPDGIAVSAFVGAGEYTLYARRGELVARITVTGDPPDAALAYRVLGLVFGVDGSAPSQ